MQWDGKIVQKTKDNKNSRQSPKLRQFLLVKSEFLQSCEVRRTTMPYTTIIMPAVPKWNVEELTGYTPKTTFWEDFSIADAFGIRSIQDTYNRASKEWKENLVYCTELVMVLNHKAWQWNDINPVLSKLYVKLFEELYDWGLNHFKGKDFEYFFSTLD